MNPFDYLPQLLNGVIMTIGLMIGALLLGIMLALLLTLGLVSKKKIFHRPANALVFFVRGTPLLVQIFLIYYGSGQFEWLQNSPLWVVLKEPFFCAVIALAINTGAYTSVLLKGAIDAIPEGEILACQALGMSTGLMMRRIMLPRAFRIMLSSYSNEVVIVLKGTSLASTITLLDLMGVTDQIIANTYATMEFLLVAGVIYLILNGLIMLGFRYLESKGQRY